MPDHDSHGVTGDCLYGIEATDPLMLAAVCASPWPSWVLGEAAWVGEMKSPPETGRIFDPGEVEKLVRQLDAPLLFEREQAERQLLQGGLAFTWVCLMALTQSLSRRRLGCGYNGFAGSFISKQPMRWESPAV